MGWLWFLAVAGPSCRESAGSLRPGQFNIEPLGIPYGAARYRLPPSIASTFRIRPPSPEKFPTSLVLWLSPLLPSRPPTGPHPQIPNIWGKTAGIQNNEGEWDPAELFRSRGPLDTVTLPLADCVRATANVLKSPRRMKVWFWALIAESELGEWSIGNPPCPAKIRTLYDGEISNQSDFINQPHFLAEPAPGPGPSPRMC
jgi:hypothetical protein